MVLLTDGENNHGLSYQRFREHWQERSAATDPIRTFPILFGEASSAELDEIARLTGGRSFDGRSADLTDVFPGDPRLPMSELPLRMRLLLYVYSTRNIVACAAALVGPALLFMDVINEGWLLITAALYTAGYFATPAPQVLDPDLTQSLSFDALLERFDRVVKDARPQLQPAMIARLDSIRQSVEEVLPRLADTRGFDDNLFTVRETIARYLPETLANYVALPSVFRVTRVLKDGKTARELLMDQLAVLDDQMKEVVGNVARGDADALLANGQFLEAKFQERDFLKKSAA